MDFWFGWTLGYGWTFGSGFGSGFRIWLSDLVGLLGQLKVAYKTGQDRDYASYAADISDQRLKWVHTSHR